MRALGFQGKAGELLARRRAWEDARGEGQRTMCDVYPFECDEVERMVDNIKLGDASPDLKMCKCLIALQGQRFADGQHKKEEREARQFGRMPDELSWVSFDSLKDWQGSRAHEVEALRTARRTCAKFAQNPYGKHMLTLFGAAGNGKTMLAAAVANECTLGVFWVYGTDLLKHLRSTFDAVGEFSYAGEFDRVLTAELLVIDDFGAEKSTDWTEQEFGHIITHRHMYNLPTVVTTNEDMLKQEGRIGSRLRDWQHSILVRTDEIPDYRIRKGT